MKHLVLDWIRTIQILIEHSKILKFIRGSEAWGNKTKEMFYSSLSLKKIYFILFPQASQPCMNFNISELVYFFIVIIIIITIIIIIIGFTISIIKYLSSFISHQELSCKGYWSAIRRKLS